MNKDKFINMINDVAINDLDKIQEFSTEWMGPGSNKVWTGIMSGSIMDNPPEKTISYYDNDGYYITDSVGDRKLINKKIDFTYKINKHGFRSQHFKKIDTTKLTILTGGCSQSFGEGLPEELRWQSFLLKNLNNLNVDLFDISAGGASCRLIIRNTISFIRNYGIPDYLFLVLPDISRNFMFDENEYKFQNVWTNKKFITNHNKKTKLFKKYTINFNEYDELMITIENILALEELCNNIKTKLVWTTWSPELIKIFSNFNFKNYINPALNFFGDSDLSKIKNTENLPYWYFANDIAHLGTIWTSTQGLNFSEVIKNDKQNKNNLL